MQNLLNWCTCDPCPSLHLKHLAVALPGDKVELSLPDELPILARASWVRVVDTNLPPPRDFTLDGSSKVAAEYTVMPYTSIMLKSKPAA